MRLREFDGELDEVSGLKEFDGELDAAIPTIAAAKTRAKPSIIDRALSALNRINGNVTGNRSVMENVPADLQPAPDAFAAGRVLADNRIAQQASRAEDAARRSQFAQANPKTAALASGAARSLQGALDAAPLAADAVNVFATNPILQALGQAPMDRAPRLPGAAPLERAAGDFTPEIIHRSPKGAWNNDEFGEWLGANLAQQGPQVAGSMAAALMPAIRAPYLLGMGAQAAGGEHTQNLNEGTDLGASVIDALTKGNIEVLSEMLPLGVFDKVKGMVSGLPTPIRGAVVMDALKRVAATGGALTAQGITGAIEESVAQIGGNASENIVLGKDTPLMEGVDRAAIVGAAAGKVMGLPNAARAFAAPTSPEQEIAREIERSVQESEFAVPAEQIARERLAPAGLKEFTGQLDPVDSTPPADPIADLVETVTQAAQATPAPSTDGEQLGRAETAVQPEKTNEAQPVNAAADGIQPVSADVGRAAATVAAGQPAPAVATSDTGIPASITQPAEPVAPPGTVRLYHGGEPGDADGPLWFSRDRRYAQGYADKSNARVWYVDVPADHPSVKADDEFGVLPATNVEMPAEIARQRKPIDQPAAPAFAAPLQIDGTRAMQIEQPTEGLRPGDIVAATGKPFKTEAAARKEAKIAGKEWKVRKGGGGFVVRHQPATDKQIANGRRQARERGQIDTDRDSLFAAIAKLGGINIDQLTKQWGFDPAEFKNLRSGIKPVARKTGGMNLDAMGERLAELGYLSRDENGKHDLSELFDLFDGELRGNKHFTPQGYNNQAQALMEAEWASQQAIDALNALPEEAQQVVEDTLDEDIDQLTEAELEARLEQEGRDLDAAGFDGDAATDGADDAGGPDPFRAEGNDQGLADADSRQARERSGEKSPGRAGESTELEQAEARAKERRIAAQRRYEADADVDARDVELAQIRRELDAVKAKQAGQDDKFDDVPFSRSDVMERPAQRPGIDSSTVNVDGVERSTFNSAGQQIAYTKPVLDAFWRWYKDGETDSRGRPVIKDGNYTNAAGQTKSHQNQGTFDAASNDAIMSRGKPSRGLSVDAVKKAIAADTFNHDVDVYATMADAPDYIRRQAGEEGGGEVEGFWNTVTNRVALIAENLDSPAHARKIARHELIGHYGLENMLQDSADPDAMNRLVRRVIQAERDGNKVIRDLAGQVDRSQPNLDDERRAKEIIAIMAERNIHNSITKRVYDAIRKFLKKIGFLKSDMTDASIAALLRDAQNYLRAAGRPMIAGQPAAAFGRASPVLDLDAPLSQQSEPVRRSLAKEVKRLRAEAFQKNEPGAESVDDRITGRELMDKIADRLGSESEARAYLEAIGVEFEGEAATALFQVSPRQAKALRMETKLPSDPLFVEAVEGTPGASITDDGLLIDLVRFQRDEQEGAQSVRTGVFYLPNGSAQAKHYKTGKNGYGGTNKFEGETLLRRPIFVKGATGGKAPEAAYDKIKGKNAYGNMRSEVLNAIGGWGVSAQQKRMNIEELLDRYGANSDLASEIIRNSTQGNTLAYALQENIVAHAVREAGFDAVVGYSKGKAGVSISEVFDVREVSYPARGMDADIHPDFEEGSFSRADEPTALESGTPLTRAEVLAKQEADAKAAKEAARQDKPRDKNVTADQVDMFNEQGSLFSKKGNGTLADLRVKWEAKGIRVSMSESAKEISLSMIAVPKEQRSNGIGSEFMRELTAYADSKGARIVLSPSTDFGGSSVARLKTFYKQFGFVENAGRNKDFTTRETMYRDAVKPMFSRTATIDRSQDDLDIARSAFTVSDPGMRDNILRAMQNNKIDLKRVIEAIREGGGIVTEQQDAYLNEELYIGRVTDQLDKFVDNRVTPLLEAIKAAKLDLDDVNSYLYARHAPERNAQLKKINPNRINNHALSGMSDAKARKIIDDFTAAGKADDLANIAKMVDAITKEGRRKIVTNGLEPADMIARWEAAYKHYVPLMADMDVQIGKKKGGFNVKGNESERSLGQLDESQNILANVIAQAQSTIMRAEKAKVGRSLLDLARNHPNDKFWKVDEAPKTRRVSPETGLVEWVEDPMFKARDNVLVVKENGVEHFIVFNEKNERAMQIASAMQNLDAAQLPWIIEASGKVTRYLATWITARNPLFWITNFARDVQGASFNLQNTPLAGKEATVLKNIPLAILGYRNMVRGDGSSKWAGYAKEFKAAGSETGYIRVFDSPEDHMADLQKQFDQMRQGAADPRKLARTLVEAIDDYNTIIENGVRLAVYQAARDNGQSIRAAGSMAKNITVNFNRRGNQSTAFNSLYMFFNASVQGNARFLIALADSRRAQAIGAAVVGIGFVLDAVNRAIGGDDDETGKSKYDQIPLFERERNWIFMDPSGSGKYAKIPMPYGPHVMANLGRIMSDMAFGPKKDAVEHALDMAKSVADGFNPMGENGSLSQYISPTITKPLVQIGENTSFSGGPVYRKANERGYAGPAYTRHFRSTGDHWVETSKLLNDITGGDKITPGKIDVPPEVIRTLITSYLTPGITQTVDKSATTATRAIQGKKVEPSQIPAASRFYGEAPEERAQERSYFEEKKKIDQQIGRVKQYAKEGDRAGMNRALETLGDGDVAAGRKIMAKWEASEKALLQLNRARKELESDAIPDEKQRTQLDKIDEKRMQLIRRVLR